MGIPEYEAKRYEGRVKDGGIPLSVHSETSDEINRAKEILERTGAQDISSTGEAAATNKPLLGLPSSSALEFSRPAVLFAWYFTELELRSIVRGTHE
jgi:hypothetical protein